jgi:hypothetical protein
MNKCAEHGLDAGTSMQLMKMAYKYGPTRQEAVIDGKDGAISTTANRPIPLSHSLLRYAFDKRDDRPWNARFLFGMPGATRIRTAPMPNDEAPSYAYDHSYVDGDLPGTRRLRNGQPVPATTWKDNMDLATLQSDVIKARRGAGKALLFDKKTGKYK